MEHRGAAQGAGRAERIASGTPYLSLIDGVRGVAALAVLFYHYVHFFMAGPKRSPEPGVTHLFPGYDGLWLLYDYGYFAVQIFWLISGFVFAQVYYGSKAGTRSFAINRLARLYPLHLLTLLVVAGLQLLALRRFGYTPLYGHYDWWHFFTQLFMASDWLREGGGYSFNGPIWSVSVEIVVYALFWLSRGVVARFGLPLVAALVLGFYFADQHWAGTSRVFSCAFYFFIGCGLNMIRRGTWHRGFQIVAPVLLAAVGTYGALAGDDWSRRVFLLPGLFGALFLVLASVETRAPRALRDACEWLGENTYGIYLWHVPLQLGFFLLLMPAVDPAIIARNWWFLAGFVLLVVAVARASYVSFEKPARDVLRHRLGSGAGRPKGGDKAPTGG